MEQERDSGAQLVGGADERRVGVPGARVRGGRVGDAPVRDRGVPREVRALLPHPVAQADHVVEPPADELGQRLRAAAADVDPTVAQHVDGVRMQRLGAAPGAARLDAGPAPPLQDRLGHLRPGAVARAQEQHPDRSSAGTAGRRARRGRDQPQAGMECGAGVGEELAARPQVQAVVGVPAVGRAASGAHQAAVAQPAEVVGGQALSLPEQRRQLAHLPVAAGQLAQQPPPHGVSGQAQETGRRRRGRDAGHIGDGTSIVVDASIWLG